MQIGKHTLQPEDAYHRSCRRNAETLVEAWGFTASDRLLHMLPIYHVHGLFVGLSCVLMSGASMAWHGGYSDQAAVAAMLCAFSVF